MPSNADVNVTPAKTSVTGATSGYLKTSDGASSFEVVSQIPAADVEGGGSSGDTWIEGTDTIDLGGYHSGTPGTDYDPGRIEITASSAPNLYAAWSAHPTVPVIRSYELVTPRLPVVVPVATVSLMAVQTADGRALFLILSHASGGTGWTFQSYDKLVLTWTMRVSS